VRDGEGEGEGENVRIVGMASMSHVGRYQEALADGKLVEITRISGAEGQEDSLQDVLEDIGTRSIDRLGADCSHRSEHDSDTRLANKYTDIPSSLSNKAATKILDSLAIASRSDATVLKAYAPRKKDKKEK